MMKKEEITNSTYRSPLHATWEEEEDRKMKGDDDDVNDDDTSLLQLLLRPQEPSQKQEEQFQSYRRGYKKKKRSSKRLSAKEEEERRQRRIRQRHEQQQQSSSGSKTTITTPSLTLRSSILGLSLSLILFTFWLLDSLKDALFSTLVENRLDYYQPRAKLWSVCGTVLLVGFMESLSNERRRRKKNGMEERRGDDEDVLDGGGVWTKMKIGDTEQDDDDDEDDVGRIPHSIFRSVGLSYILIFLFFSWSLSYHPNLNTSSSRSTSKQEETTSLSRGTFRVMGYALYLAIESFGSISVATFWSFVNSNLTLAAAEQSYGTIIAMAQLGAFLGSTLATTVGNNHHVNAVGGVSGLLMVACLVTLIQIGVMEFYRWKFPFRMREDEGMDSDDGSQVLHDILEQNVVQRRRRAPTKRRRRQQREEDNDFVSGIYLILRHNYLLLILGVSCLYEISLTCLDYEMKLMGLDHFSSRYDQDTTTTTASFASFMGRYGQLTNLLSLLLSYYAFPHLLKLYGLRITIRIFPTLLLLLLLLTYLALPGNLTLLFLSISLLKAITYSINDPAKEILYLPTSSDIKFRAKFWIDVVGARVAKAFGSGVNTYAGSADRIRVYGIVPSVFSGLGLWVACFKVGGVFDRLVTEGLIVGLDDLHNAFNDHAHHHHGHGFEPVDTDDHHQHDHQNHADDREDGIAGDNFSFTPTSFLLKDDEDDYDSGWESNTSIELLRQT